MIKKVLRGILTLFLIAAICVMMLTFVGVGFVGGVVLKSWDSIDHIDLGQLEYREVDTWKQHLEVYSSLCTVQQGDSVDFLLDKLKRLEYQESGEFIKPSIVGQYSIGRDEQGQSERLWIYLQGFHFPREDREPYQVELSVVDGKIETIQNDDGEKIDSFDLRPELLNALYDRKGEAEAREIVKLVQIPDSLLQAFLAVEDQRFYDHWGVDFLGILRASVHNAQLFLGQVQGTLQGASTVTQQLTRNIYLTRERRLLRKVKEALLAVRIERQFSKDEILERYLNLINLGRYGSQEVLGVQEAAQNYFGKNVWELELHECATLAGIPKSPTRYSPIRYPDRSKERRNLVLGLMLKAGFINAEEYDANVQKPVVIEVPKSAQGTGGSHFLEYVHERLIEKPELEGHLYNQGLRVYTTIDPSMQEIAERAVADHLRELDQKLRGSTSRYRNLPDYDENKNNPNGINPITSYLQAGLIALEPQTGHIKAMVGGRDFYITRQEINFFNRSVDAYRQPGSSFKPIVFAALLDFPPLITPATVVRDEAWSIDVGTPRRWRPRNYGQRYYGDITARTVLERSINIATARMMWETPIEENEKPAGLNRTLAIAKRLGIDANLPAYPSLALGAGGLPVLQMTGAYSVFANGGVRKKPIGIHYVEDQYGDILIENQTPSEQVLDEGVAYLMTHLLKGVIDSSHGTGRRARVMGLTRPAAGKTGTTDDYTDAWFVGYIQNLAAGVWVGFNDPKWKTTFPGAQGALPIWARFMIEGARGPVRDFDKPANVVLRDVDKNTGLLKYQGKCPEEDVIKEAFIVGYEPKMLCNAHR